MGDDGGCGGFGQILVLAIIIAATIYSAGALAASGALGADALGVATLEGATTGGGLGATFAAGGSVLGGGAGVGTAIAAGAVSSALGSVAGQTFGIATGMQQDFDWRSVGLAALSGGVSGGLGGFAPLGGDPASFGNLVTRAAVGSALTQGIGVATGLQRSFSWQSVAASGIGAGVGYGVGQALQGTGINPYVGAGLSGFAAGTATALARGGRVSVTQIATDAFGQALGNAFVDNIQNPGTQAQKLQGFGPASGLDYVNGADLQSDYAAVQRQSQPYYDQLVGAFGGGGPVDRNNDVLLAAGPGYSGMGSGSQRDANIARMLNLASQPEAMGSEVPFRVEVYGVGWTGANVLPDGTQVYRSTDPTNDLRMIETANGAGTVPILNGYGLTGVRTYGGIDGADLLYSPGVANGTNAAEAAQDATNVYSDSAPVNNPYSFNSNWIAGAGLGIGVPNFRQATPVPTNPILPVNNGRWTGVPGNSGWVSTNASVNAVTGGRPVQFRNDMVNFDPWSQGRINVSGMTGANSDLRLGRNILREQYGLPTDQAAKDWLRDRSLTLHHNANGLSLDLIPSDLHNTANGGIRHTGGASILRSWDAPGTPLQYYRANQLATGARYLGAAGIAYGAYTDGTSLYNQFQTSRQTGSYGNTAAEATRIVGGWAGAWAVSTAGAEFGAGFGSVFGPMGTVAGGVIGGAVGGAFGYWGGSYAATHVSYDIGRWLSK